MEAGLHTKLRGNTDCLPSHVQEDPGQVAEIVNRQGRGVTHGAEVTPLISEESSKVLNTKSALWCTGAMMGISAMTVSAATSWYAPENTMKRAMPCADIMLMKPCMTRHTAGRGAKVKGASTCSVEARSLDYLDRMHEDHAATR